MSGFHTNLIIITFVENWLHDIDYLMKIEILILETFAMVCCYHVFSDAYCKFWNYPPPHRISPPIVKAHILELQISINHLRISLTANLPYENPLMFYRSCKMDTQEAYPGFMIMERTSRKDENIFMD